MVKQKNKRQAFRGQTSIEYTMILGVVAIIIFSVGTKLKAALMTSPEKCLANPRTVMCRISGMFKFAQDEEQMIYYTLPR